MTGVQLAAFIALCAALASATGDVIRQRSAQEITDKQVGHLHLFGLSLRDARWWLGGMAAVVNYSLQAVALIWGSVMLVTTLQVTALLFALPIYSWVTKHRITRSEWIWAVALAAALAVAIKVGDPTEGHHRAPLHVWFIVAAVVTPLLVLCVVLARVWVGRPQAAALLAVVAGASLALFAVLTKGVVDVVHDHGFAGVLAAPEFYPWLVTALCGMIFQQSAFRAGALTASLPTITVAKPVVATVLGITVLGESLDASGYEAVVLLLAVVVVIAATVGLARGEAATMVAETGQDIRRVPEDGPAPDSAGTALGSAATR